MRSPVADLLRRLCRAFESLGVPWYLFGAHAAMLHGASRVTADVDVTVRLGDTEVSEMVSALDQSDLAPTYRAALARAVEV